MRSSRIPKLFAHVRYKECMSRVLRNGVPIGLGPILLLPAPPLRVFRRFDPNFGHDSDAVRLGLEGCGPIRARVGAFLDIRCVDWKHGDPISTLGHRGLRYRIWRRFLLLLETLKGALLQRTQAIAVWLVGFAIFVARSHAMMDAGDERIYHRNVTDADSDARFSARPCTCLLRPARAGLGQY